MPNVTFYDKITGEITGTLSCDEASFNENTEGKEWVEGLFEPSSFCVQKGKIVARKQVEEKLPEPVRTRKKRKTQYLIEFPIEKQLEALVEAADNRPEKLLAMIERMKEIKNEVKTLA